jgi:hypothetical protein
MAPGLRARSRVVGGGGRHPLPWGRGGRGWSRVRAVLVLALVTTLTVRYLRYSFRVLSVDAGEGEGLPLDSDGSGGRGVSVDVTNGGGAGAVIGSPAGSRGGGSQVLGSGGGHGDGDDGAVSGAPATVTAKAARDGAANGGEGSERTRHKAERLEQEEEVDEEEVDEAEDGDSGGGEDPARTQTKCHCRDGRAADCTSLTAGRTPNPRELVIAAVCGIAEEVVRHRRDVRRGREAGAGAEAVKKPWFVRKDAGDVMRIGGGNGEHWLSSFFTAEEREAAAAVNAFELRAAAAIIRAVPDLIRPTHRDLLPANIFYSSENHGTIRDKKDAFHNDSVGLLPAVSPALRYASCAVVGSSGVMTQSGLGPRIDEHHAVVGRCRLNLSNPS